MEAAELFVAADFLDAEVEWIDLVGVDQNSLDTRASHHGGRSRAGQAAADDRNVDVPRKESRPGCDILHPEWQTKACETAGFGPDSARKMFLIVLTRIKIPIQAAHGRIGPSAFARAANSLARFVHSREALNPQTPKAFPAFSFRLT